MHIGFNLSTLAAMSALLLDCGDKKTAKGVVAELAVKNTIGKSVVGRICAICQAIGAAALRPSLVTWPVGPALHRTAHYFAGTRWKNLPAPRTSCRHVP